MTGLNLLQAPIAPGRPRFPHWKSGALNALYFIIGLVVSPVAVLLDLGRPGRRLPKVWVLSYIALAVLLTAAWWSVGHIIDLGRDSAVEMMADYSLLRRSLTEGTLSDIPYSDEIVFWAARNALDPALVAAVIQKESGFEPMAVSPRGARGLMQLTPVAWREMNPRSPCSGAHPPPACKEDCVFSPYENIRVGTAFLRQLLDEFHGDFVLAFAAYNAGARAVARASSGTPGVPAFRETQVFVRDVLHNWLRLRAGPPEGPDPALLLFFEQAEARLPWAVIAMWGLLFIWVLAKIPGAGG